MIRIITDSTSSLPKDLREKLGIHLLNLVVNRGGVSHVEGEMDLDAFYADIYEMADDIPTSSQPSALSIEAALEEAAAAGDEVLGIFISGRMSGTFEGVARAARETAKRYPDFKYALIDSMTNCMELGWAVVAACEARDAGRSLEECVEAATRAMSSTRFIFAPESLKFLEKGGRIGKASALLGNMLNISPILTVKNGEAATFSKVRTQKKALAKMVDVFQARCGESWAAQCCRSLYRFVRSCVRVGTRCDRSLGGEDRDGASCKPRDRRACGSCYGACLRMRCADRRQVRNFARDHCFVVALTPVPQDSFGANLCVRSLSAFRGDCCLLTIPS